MSRWLFFPSPVVSTLDLATATGWNVFGGPTIRRATGWSAGTDGTNSVDILLRDDSNGAYLQFTDSTAASAWLSTYSTYSVRITDAFSNVYEWSGGAMALYAGKYIRLPMANWSGNLPTGGTNATTLELYT